MSDTQKRDAVLEEFAYDAGIHRVWGVAGMADEILRLRAENVALRQLAEAEFNAVKTERDTLRNIVKNYGKARLRHLLDRELVQATFAVNYQVLKDAREPEMLFATAISDVMHELREFMHTQEQANAAQQQITAMADAAYERAKSRFPSTTAKQGGDA